MLTKAEILSFLKEKKSQLLSDYQLTKIGLFGSFACGTQTEYSDIDLIIEFQPNVKDLSNKKLAIKNLVCNRFNKEVDLCREKYLKPYYKSQILETAIYV